MEEELERLRINLEALTDAAKELCIVFDYGSNSNSVFLIHSQVARLKQCLKNNGENL